MTQIISHTLEIESVLTYAFIITYLSYYFCFYRHNEDGSYTYGFEGADGSFKIETKQATGEVIGKYGYVDDSGKLRVVEYGANKYGFQPAGEGITIPAINIENDTDKTENYENDSVQHTSRPEIKVPPPSRSQKRKPQQKPIHFVTQEQRTRPQTLSQYFMQEQEDTHQPKNQRQYISASDVNSLQFLIGNEQRENPTLQYHSNNIPSARRQFLQPTTSEEDSQNSERLFRSGIPFSATFEADSPSQFQITPNQLLQTRFSSSFEAEPNLPPSNKKFSKGQLRPKSKSQLLPTPTDDIQPQNVIRRNSNINQGNSRSILDELLKQYPIPNGSPAINDFSFTYN